MTQDEPAFNRLRITSPPQNASTSLRLTDPTTPTSSLGFLKRSMENSKSKAYTALSYSSTLDSMAATTTAAASSFAQPRRARAGTMPSQSSISPYAPIGPPPSFNESLSNSSSFTTSSLLSEQTLASRHRSGSLTLPKPSLSSSSAFGNPIFSTSWSDHSRALAYGNAPLTPTTDQMLREDNSDSIVRTLMSLGLDDDDRKNTSATQVELSSQANSSSTTNHDLRLPVELPPKPIMNSNRYRSYSVNATDKYEDPLLQDSVHLMSEHTVQYFPTSQNRTRAVSLGMADFAANDAYLSRQQASTLRHDALTLDEEDLEDFQGNSNLQISLGDADLLSRMMNNGQDTASETEENYTYGSSYGSQLLPSQAQANAQTPTRSLWIGNIDSSISEEDLQRLFSPFGPIESLRLLVDKECAFINFSNVEDAVRAKDEVLGRLNGRVGQCVVRVGFGKIEAGIADPSVLQPTRALWIGSLPPNTTSAKLHSLFSPFGNIESARVLTHKNCGFINFDTVESAMAAKKALQHKEVLGSGTGAVRIGFAKATTQKAMEEASSVSPPGGQASVASSSKQERTIDTVRENPESGSHAKSSSPETMEPSNLSKIMAIMTEFGMDSDDGPVFKIENRTVCKYRTSIPPITEANPSRKLDAPRLRELRKKLDNSHTSAKEVQAIAEECMDDIVELSSDYIGNTIVQKLFERCSEATKVEMLKPIAPHLATIGVHKNGTWAAQKIIDTASTDEQMQIICGHIQPFVPPLMLDQFGNYVVQCCLRLGPIHNQFIFDAIVDKTREIAQGRFGARAIRASLESAHISMRQKKYAASAIVANAFSLGGNPNGALLMTWLLDTSGLPRRYNILAPRIAPYMSAMCTSKLSSAAVLKVINQRQEIEAQLVLLNTLANDDHDQVLRDILADSSLGMNMIHKILSSTTVESKPKRYLAEKVKQILALQTPPTSNGGQAYKRLWDEVDNLLNENTSPRYSPTNNRNYTTDSPIVAPSGPPPQQYINAAAYGSPPYPPSTPSIPLYSYPMANNVYPPGMQVMPPYGYYPGMAQHHLVHGRSDGMYDESGGGP
ncbi:hypothetical protein K450DRAFT_260858 [Umbelopsis ramanniana AG]|uniref:Uncharacterized protein n=1 Tax=Umbelopsis ramanniana AG TaxID=1314678 RepID=A0AAD5E2U2_UMBRA|nr:uncharacterized protein K450DRAFT_260858 [Umbelopsis ramanniana AG]KAI8575652.1 hypothetical protein K450DRAFT_260858 [Umbelopsis ramanniana AG]